MEVNVKIGKFEGPFQLLFHLIEKNKIDIIDIPIVLLTNQYMEYIENMKNNDMETMSEFILMAATLLEIKSKMLIPTIVKENEEYIDPREELVEKLIEYKRAKLLVEILKQQYNQNVFTKEAETNIINLFKNKTETTTEELLQDVTLLKLYKIFEETTLRREQKIDKVRSGFDTVKKDKFTIENKSEFILNMLTINENIFFSNLFTEAVTKIELVTTFLAILELIKLKKIKIIQKDNFDNILIERV